MFLWKNIITIQNATYSRLQCSVNTTIMNAKIDILYWPSASTHASNSTIKLFETKKKLDYIIPGTPK